MKASNTLWRDQLLGEMPPQLAQEIDDFETELTLRKRGKLDEAIISIGFAKSRENLEATLPYFHQLVHRVRKIRMMGSAALALTYVASGRFDAYIERGIRLWDIAAGGLILECAGGEFWRQAVAGEYAYRMIGNNGLLRKHLRVPD